MNPGALVSPSKDGELAARFREARDHRGAAPAAAAVPWPCATYVAIKDQDLSPLIAPDGSTGPAHEFKPGAIMLARSAARSSRSLLLHPRRSGHLDRLLPLPFSRVEVVFEEPIELEPLMQMSESPETIERMGAALAAEDAAIARARH